MERIVHLEVTRPFVLYVEFDDGVAGEYDMSDRLNGPVFEPLRDPATFAQVRLAEWGAEQVDMTSESRAARWTFRDANRDRKPDVVVTWFDYEDAGGCTPDAGGWQPPNSPGECGGDPTDSVLEYDPASDTWDETAYPR